MYKKIGFKKSMRTMLAMVGLSLLLTAGLGATVSAAPPVAPAAEMHDEAGVLILSVVPDSPADEAGIVRGDIVLAVDGEAIDSAESFAETIGALSAGDEIAITVLHGDDTLDLATTLGERAGRTYLGVVPYAEEDLSAEEADVDEANADEANTDEANDKDASDETADEADEEDADKDEADEPTERRSLRSMMPFGQGGAMIGEVVEGGPAAEAGLVPGDLIVAVDGQDLNDDVDFAELISSYAPGDVVTLTVTNIESNETLEVPVTLGAHPDDEERAFLGISYALVPSFPGMGDVAPDEDMAQDDDADLDEDEAIEESDEGGVMIADVLAGGPADAAGLVPGDLIVAVDGEELSDDVDFAELIGAYAPGDEVTLTVTNAESNEKMEIPVVLGVHPDDEERAFLGIAYVLAPAMPGMGDLAPDEDADDSDEDAAPAERGSLRSMMPFGQGGAMIAEVVEGGPAAEAGLMAGDLIVAVDGQELSDDADFAELIGSYAPGQEVTLTVTNVETNEKMEVPVVLGANPDDETKAFLGIAYVLAPALPETGNVAPGDDADGNDDDANISEDDEGDLDDDEAIGEPDEADEDAAPRSRYHRFGMPSSLGGAKISDVVADGPAAEAGLIAGDLIIAVDGEELGSANLGDLIAAYAPGDEVVLTIQHARSDETSEMTVVLGAHPDDAERAYLGVAYIPVMNRAWDSPNRRYRAQPAPYHRQEPKQEDPRGEEPEHGDGCFHGHEGCDGHHGFGEHGDMMMPFFHHGLENFDLDQLSQEDRDALQEMFPFLFPDVEPESESQGEDGL